MAEMDRSMDGGSTRVVQKYRNQDAEAYKQEEPRHIAAQEKLPVQGKVKELRERILALASSPGATHFQIFDWREEKWIAVKVRDDLGSKPQAQPK